ncbi:MAG: hypothetical protein IT449_04035 [Phycisphaerales bacterium]|nr:hypothetical protein [Phycisphaerales bacterium]
MNRKFIHGAQAIGGTQPYDALPQEGGLGTRQEDPGTHEEEEWLAGAGCESQAARCDDRLSRNGLLRPCGRSYGPPDQPIPGCPDP